MAFVTTGQSAIEYFFRPGGTLLSISSMSTCTIKLPHASCTVLKDNKDRCSCSLLSGLIAGKAIIGNQEQ